MNRLFFFFLLLIIACRPATSPDEGAEEAPVTAASEATSPEVPSVLPAEATETPQSRYFYGQIDEFGPFVHLELTETEGAVSGRYFYAKHQKMLTLEGHLDTSGNYTLDEFHDGAMTGRWKFILDDNDALVGEWVSLPAASKLLPLVASPVPPASREAQQAVEFASYAHRFETGMFNPTTQSNEVFEAVSLLKVGFLGAEGFLFWYDVIGVNGHTGNLEGFAYMTSADTAEFVEEEGCMLSFTFDWDKETVSITEKDCEAFRGARAFFQGELQKES